MKTTCSLAIAASGLTALGLALAAGSASATPFGPGTPQGVVDELSGGSAFGNPDGNPGSLTCPACDADVNFLTYSNPDGNDWRDDIFTLFGVPTTAWTTLASDPTAEGGDDGNPWNDRWVFFYAVENTNPLGDPNAELENFNVTKTLTNGDPFEQNPYANGGFGDAVDLLAENTHALDTPNDGAPSTVEAKTLDDGFDDDDPSSLLFTGASGPNPIASAAIRAGSQAYSGALFRFDPLIGGFNFSDVMWLSSNAPHAGFVWAETESPGGFGAAGDVAGIVNIPVPASLTLFGIGLLGLGLARRRTV